MLSGPVTGACAGIANVSQNASRAGAEKHDHRGGGDPDRRAEPGPGARGERLGYAVLGPGLAVNDFGECEIAARLGLAAEQLRGTSPGRSPEPGAMVAVPPRGRLQQGTHPLVDPGKIPLVEAAREEIDPPLVIPVSCRVSLIGVERGVAADEQHRRAGDMPAPGFGDLIIARPRGFLGPDNGRAGKVFTRPATLSDRAPGNPDQK